MKAEKNEILLIYNSGKEQDMKALGYASSIDIYKVNERDIAKDPLTETQLVELADDMGTEVLGLLDRNSDYFFNELKGKDFSNEEILKIMRQFPEVLKTPIAYLNGDTFLVDSPYSFINKGIEIEGIKSKSGNSFETQKND